MAAYFFDVDGTILEHGTQNLLPGILQHLQTLSYQNHQIIITTRRNGFYADDHPFSIKSLNATLEYLKQNGVKINCVLTGIESPRIVVNDEGAFAINRKINQPWY